MLRPEVLPEISLRWPEAADNSGKYIPQHRIGSGWQLTVVYVGAAGCAGSNLEIVPPAIEKIKLSLARQAEDAGMLFTAIGVAVDWKVEDGIEHLSHNGKFDEIVVGNNWSNLGALRYVWDDVPGQPSTPSIVVLARQFMSDSTGITVLDEDLLVRKVGADQIESWANSDSRIPRLAEVVDDKLPLELTPWMKDINSNSPRESK